MQKNSFPSKIKHSLLLLSALLLSLPSIANAAKQEEITPKIQGPWMTGPLIAPAGTGVVIQKGHIKIEPFWFTTNLYGRYDSAWALTRPTYHETILTPSVTTIIGLTKWMDLQIITPYIINIRHNEQTSHLADPTVGFGFQVLRHNDKTLQPDIRLVALEVFPAAPYRNLDPNKFNTDAIGSGAYQTKLAAVIQKPFLLQNGKYLRGRLTFLYIPPTHANLQGFNTYGGGYGTDGRLTLGNRFVTDLAFEYTLTQHWVPALNITYTTTGSHPFNGTLGRTAAGKTANINTGSDAGLEFAPALEYNFNAHVGVIGGVWFAPAGRNYPAFTSGVVAVNMVF